MGPKKTQNNLGTFPGPDFNVLNVPISQFQQNAVFLVVFWSQFAIPSKNSQKNKDLFT